MVFLFPGAIHIHTIYSDGTGRLQDIVRAAKKAGLKWIVITDHNKMVIKEGMYDGICVIVGEEISPDHGDHYLAFDIKKVIPCNSSPQGYIDKVKEQGGFGFIAHPDESKTRNNEFESVGWTDWDVKNFDGLEIWNYMSNWADYYDDTSIIKTVYAYLCRNKVMSGPTAMVIKWWDKLNNDTSGIVPAIGGVDAHAFKIAKGFIFVKIFPYTSNFKALTNFIHTEQPLSDDFETCKRAVLDSIKAGKNIIMNRGLNKGKTCPEFYVQSANQKTYAGEKVSLDDASKLVIELPRMARIKVLRNGKVVLQERAKQIELLDLKEGKYRFEAYYRNIPWIFSNPILVK